MKLRLTTLLVLALAGPAAAQQDVFSRTYVREPGGPITVPATFAVCDSVGPFTLVITNGPGGAPKAGSATITVNGAEIVRPSDFSRGWEQIERAVTSLLEDNHIDVRLGGSPGGTILVAMREVQACAMRITSPAPGSIVTAHEVLVRGTYPSSFGLDVGVTVNGVRGPAGGGQFAALVPVDPQVTQLTAVAKDAAGTTLDDDTIPITVQAAPDETAVSLRASPPHRRRAPERGDDPGGDGGGDPRRRGPGRRRRRRLRGPHSRRRPPHLRAGGRVPGHGHRDHARRTRAPRPWPCRPTTVPPWRRCCRRGGRP